MISDSIDIALTVLNILRLFKTLKVNFMLTITRKVSHGDFNVCMLLVYDLPSILQGAFLYTRWEEIWCVIKKPKPPGTGSLN
jgi:hypothetical protein